MEKRKRSFPIYYDLSKEPGGGRIVYADEYEALHKASQPDQPREEPAEPATPPPQAVQTTPSESLAPSASTVSGEGYGAPSIASGSASPRPPDFSRHARRCAVCSHPDRDAIEGDFIRWRSPGTIARDYNIADRSSIYRHAHSAGLFPWRKRELGRTLESILELCEDIPLESADIIIRAARIYAHLDENGKWFEPPRTNFIFHGPAPALYPLESVLPTNSGRARSRGAEIAPVGEEKIHHNDDPTRIGIPSAHREPKDGVGTFCEPGGESHGLLEGEEKANRNIHQIKDSVNSMNPEEKANS